MSALDISTIGTEVLRKKAEPVTKITPELKELAQKMLMTMYQAPGIGLAAPQIGRSIRLVVIDVEWKRGGDDDDWDDDDDEEEFDFDSIENAKPYILFNPEIIEKDGEEVEYEEGCLSVPEIYANVVRPERVVVKALDENGKEITLKAEGLLSRCLQHEIDHLEGVLFVDKNFSG